MIGTVLEREMCRKNTLGNYAVDNVERFAIAEIVAAADILLSQRPELDAGQRYALRYIDLPSAATSKPLT